jgi:hypothetical protein
MMERRPALISKIYDRVESALWVFFLYSLGSFLFLFSHFGRRRSIERAEMEWQSELGADANRYCAKWGLR